MSEKALYSAVLWRCIWTTPSPPEEKSNRYHTAYVAAPSLAAAARIVQQQVTLSLGENPEAWPEVRLEPYGDVTWEAP